MKKAPLLLSAIISGFILIAAQPTEAALFKLDFTATGFPNYWDYDPLHNLVLKPPPVDVISGSFVYEASSLTSPIDKLISVDLNIDGYEYLLSGVVLFNTGYGYQYISGITYGYESLWGTDDFMLSYYNYNYNWGYRWFAYSTDTIPCNLTATQFTMNISPVPEPGTMMLLGSGLVGLVGYGRRRMRK